MKAELKKKWIEALRGQGKKKYKQGKGQLRDKNDNFCCLGVLCDIIDPLKWCILPNDYVYSYTAEGSSDNRLYLPFSLRKHFNDWNIGGGTIQTILVNANDGYEQPQKNFDEIADMVEELVPIDPE